MLKTLHDPQMCIDICSPTFGLLDREALVTHTANALRWMAVLRFRACVEIFENVLILRSSSIFTISSPSCVSSNAFNCPCNWWLTFTQRTRCDSRRSIYQIQERISDRSCTKSARYRRSAGKIAPPASSQNHCGCWFWQGERLFAS